MNGNQNLKVIELRNYLLKPASRERFLPEFYYGAIWKEFGGEANKMMIDSDDVCLLKPLNDEQIFRKQTAVEDRLLFRP